jgi:threonine/homoserine/homoserine lactone efflux protein
MGLIMGLVYAAAPGPVNVETLRRGLQGGFIDCLAVQTGSSIGRIVYALLALFGAGLLLQGATIQLTLGVFGMTVLFYLGINAIRGWRDLAGYSGDATESSTISRHAFWTGAILSLANPLAIVFWLSIGSRVAHEPGLDGATFLLGFFAGCMIVSLFMAIFASFWQTRLTAKVALTISWACGLVLIGFGFRLGYTLGTTFHFW